MNYKKYMKIAIIGEIHQDGWKTLEKSKFNAFEVIDIEKNNLKKEIKEVDGIIIRAAPNLTSDILENCNKLKMLIQS